MKKPLSRRDLMGRAGLMLGGAVTLGMLQGCGDEDDPCPVPQECPPAADNAAKIKDFPYEKHLPAGFQLDKDAIQEAAYHGYYAAAPAGGCGHGAYSALLADLARAGNPFDQLPSLFGVFGGGGIATYGSICGAALSGNLIINTVVANGSVRGAMMQTLMRWYETSAFPAYTPDQVDAKETGLALGFNDSSLPPVVQVQPGSHLCHASVSGWCAAQRPMVSATSADKKARCARVTADVAGKVVDMINAYLASSTDIAARTFTGAAPGTDVTGCTTCHDAATVKLHRTDVPAPTVQSGMSCPTCHTDKLPGGALDPATHSPTACTPCHEQ